MACPCTRHLIFGTRQGRFFYDPSSVGPGRQSATLRCLPVTGFELRLLRYHPKPPLARAATLVGSRQQAAFGRA
jgi:hypothetical protein